MKESQDFKFDEIGYWSEIKLEIIREYATAYSTILSAEKQTRLSHAYVDAFSGAGIHKSKNTGEFISGSPINALFVNPPFKDYYYIDIDSPKVEYLRNLIADLGMDDSNIHIRNGDCNDMLLKEVFPNIQWKDYRRGLCLLDPYGLQLSWEVIAAAGVMNSIDMFLNFPMMDMNRNVIWRNYKGVHQNNVNRMNRFWGDDSWKMAAYDTEYNLFGEPEKTDNKAIIAAFKKRLHDIAGFGCVIDPLPMRNTKGATVYYLFFASQKPVALNIIEKIFTKFKDKEMI